MGGFELIFGIVPIVVIVIVIMATSVRILRDYERAVIFRFGRRANAVVNPGGEPSRGRLESPLLLGATPYARGR
jgi:regulator of protease activity HflC (stomatin/prohibitin superfamily)